MHTDGHTRQILDWIGLSEGGLVDHPNDPGGRTNKGITQRVYNAWRRTQGKPQLRVDHITLEEADQIIVEQYFNPIKFTNLPKGIDYTVADFSVNSGPKQAAKCLQRALNGICHSDLVVDGMVGIATLDAVRRATDRGLVPALIRSVNAQRLEFMQKIRHGATGARLWDTFGKGWGRRVSSVEKRSMALAKQISMPAEPDVDTPKAEDQGYRTWVQRWLWPDQ